MTFCSLPFWVRPREDDGVLNLPQTSPQYSSVTQSPVVSCSPPSRAAGFALVPDPTDLSDPCWEVPRVPERTRGRGSAHDEKGDAGPKTSGAGTAFRRGCGGVPSAYSKRRELILTSGEERGLLTHGLVSLVPPWPMAQRGRTRTCV